MVPCCVVAVVDVGGLKGRPLIGRSGQSNSSFKRTRKHHFLNDFFSLWLPNFSFSLEVIAYSDSKMTSTKRAPDIAPEVPEILVDPTPTHMAKYEKGRFLGKVLFFELNGLHSFLFFRECSILD